MHRSIALLSVLALVLLGCSDDNGDNGTGPDVNSPKIRLLHAVYDGGGLDLRVNGQLIHEDVTFLESSGYKACIAGDRQDVSVHLTGNEQVLKLATRSLSTGAFYTMYCYPPLAAFAAGVESDNMSAAPENARIKFVNASFAASQELEEYALMVTGRKEGTNLHPFIRRTEATQYTDVIAGTYSFTLKKMGDDDFSRTYDLVNLDPASAYTIVLHGTLDESDAYPFALRMYKDNGSATNDVVDFVEVPTGTALFMTTIAGAGPVDVAVDGGSPQIRGLRYGDDSEYRTFGAQQHVFTASTGTTPLVLGQTINVPNGGASTIILVGDANQNNMEGIQLSDATAPSASKAMVRFVHTVSDAPAGTVATASGPVPGMGNKAHKGASSFGELDPMVYALEFRDAAADTVLSTESIRFDAGKIYTLWYGGRFYNSSLKARTLTHN